MKWSTILFVCYCTIAECNSSDPKSSVNLEDMPGPPDHTDVVGMARFIIHVADWASMATISALPDIKGYPFSSLQTMADGTFTNSTGIPYFYMTVQDFSFYDLMKDNQVTILVSLKQTKYCDTENLDAIDPRCARVMISGIVQKISKEKSEYEFARKALLERHPAIANFPKDHNWFVAKMKISQILLFDWFGGAKKIPVRDYLKYDYTAMKTRRAPLRIDMGPY